MDWLRNLDASDRRKYYMAEKKLYTHKYGRWSWQRLSLKQLRAVNKTKRQLEAKAKGDRFWRFK